MTDSLHPVVPAPGEVHVWWIDLGTVRDEAETSLSPDERARAARFHRQTDRIRWARARAAVRHILAGYLRLPPRDVEFAAAFIVNEQTVSFRAERGISRAPGTTPWSRDSSFVGMTRGGHAAQGQDSLIGSPAPSASGAGNKGPRVVSAKPALTNDPRLRFNLAHAGDRAVLAVAWEREVGIDLEPIDAGLDLPPLLTVACTPAEITRIEALPPDQRIEAFVALWTVKESYLKGIGVGVFREPRALDVDFSAGGSAIIHDPHAGGEPLRWDVRFLDAGPGWVAALAVAGFAPTPVEFAWPPPR